MYLVGLSFKPEVAHTVSIFSNTNASLQLVATGSGQLGKLCLNFAYYYLVNFIPNKISASDWVLKVSESNNQYCYRTGFINLSNKAASIDPAAVTVVVTLYG